MTSVELFFKTAGSEKIFEDIENFINLEELEVNFQFPEKSLNK